MCSIAHLAQYQKSDECTHHGHQVANRLVECVISHGPVELFAHKQIHDRHDAV